MKFALVITSRFRKDVRLLIRRGYNMELLKIVLKELSQNGDLPAKNKSHKLFGKYTGFYESHLLPDWLIIWRKENNRIFLTRTGTHADLF
jgi:mRNA interferase YafQ